MVSMRQALALIAAASLAAAAIVAVVFQDNITRFNLNPRIPYQIYTPPPPPAYGARGAWVLWPSEAGAGLADVFYVHSTTYSARRHWNAPVNAKKADATLRRVAAPNEVGPFMGLGAVYAPRYRQATLFANFTHKYDGLAARELAYGDVATAFETFLKERSPERPFILVGYGQGGLHVLGLLQHRVAKDETLRTRLAAAYVIGEPTPISIFDNGLAAIAPCRTSGDIRCVVSYIDLEPAFDDDRRRYRDRALAWRDNQKLVSLPAAPLLCVNPLSWKLSEEPVSAEMHIGAASATGLQMGETPPAIAKATGAQCNNGILTIDPPQQKFLRRKHWFGDQWRAQDFNLFYHDLTADVTRRVRNLNLTLEQEARFLAPIEEAVDLEVSPINKAPE
jgi:Protein of unknown function (DUF3089)